MTPHKRSPPSSHGASASGALLLWGLAVAEGVGHVANQSQVLLEADLSIIVFIQAVLHLLNGRGAVRILEQAEGKDVTRKQRVNEKNANSSLFFLPP